MVNFESKSIHLYHIDYHSMCFMSSVIMHILYKINNFVLLKAKVFMSMWIELFAWDWLSYFTS